MPAAALEALPSPRSGLGVDAVRLGVSSETSLLRQVIVHTPGRELELITPDSRLDLLFDDILYVDQACKEHELMCAVFETVVGRPDAVLEVSRLLREALQDEAARFALVDDLCSIARVTNLQAFEKELKGLPPDELHRFVLTGELPFAVNAPPLPNLVFTRDLAAVVNDHVILSCPATAARAREGFVIRLILNHHPAFAGFRDRIIALPAGVTFEGGDLLVASAEVVLIGLSERTSFGGIMAVAQQLFERTSVRHVVMVDLPKRRASMHLDTVFTFCGPDECVVFPPLFAQGVPGTIVHFMPGDGPRRLTGEVRPDFKGLLEELLGRAITFIPCGGPDPLNQQREQWTDGANFFAIAPHVVIGYERNHHTFEMMRAHGYRIVSAEGFLSYHAESRYEPKEKIAIKLGGMELSRGRGGPRCMTLPVARNG